jgi:hypothetical protein
MSWRGYFIRATKTNTIFPNEYIAWESYDSEPNHREEIKAYRDDNTRNLTRVTAEGTKSSLAFTVRSNLHLSDKIAIQNFFTDAEDDALERKINLEYWNDEDNTYKTADFYRPDIKFTIKKITEDDIIYKEFTIDLVEY